ncbi:MAG: type 1 glutamine amidotransferase domain-containing protein [Microthrixaceae bacterium]
MTADLQGTKVAFLVANEGVEQVELTEPWQALLDAGAEPVLVAPRTGDVQAFDHLDKADVFQATVAADEVDVEDYAALVLPGGVANPDQLRTESTAVHLVQDLVQAARPIAAICHAPWTMIEAGVVKGRTMTSWPSLRTDLTNAGAHWIDEKVVVCTDGPNTIISSRRPDDLRAFCAELVQVLSPAHGSSAPAPDVERLQS